MAGRRTPRARRIYRRRRPLNADVRRCGREGVAKARQALEHPDPEQLTLEIVATSPSDEFEEANGQR